MSPEIWVDSHDQVAYIKGSKQNKSTRLARGEFLAFKDLDGGTITKLDGTVFYPPIKRKISSETISWEELKERMKKVSPQDYALMVRSEAPIVY